MASNVLSGDPYTSPGDRRKRPASRNVRPLESLLRPLASLKLTVVLFALAIFIVFAGTVAQVNADVWTVVHHYFRSFFTWIDLQIFFPRTIHVSGGFPFPGGWLIGGLLVVNLLAAHSMRFKVQARGLRLFAGLAVIVAGIVVTWFVIRGLDTADSKMLWNGMKLALTALLGLSVYGLATIGWHRRLEIGFLAAATALEAVLLGWLLYRGDAVPDDSSMRILWELVQGSIAGLVLLAGCVLAFKKRGAIVLIHAGVALMMLNELYVGMTSHEAQMRLTPGQVQNYVDDIRTIEFAIVDPSGKIKDNVVVVPKDILLSGGITHDDRLPFDIQVADYYQNADILEPISKDQMDQLPPGTTGNSISTITGAISDIPKDQVNPATAGLGLKDIAVPKRAGAGTDTDSQVDISTAYVTLLKRGSSTPIGTYLVSVGLDEPQQVTVDGHDYDIALRFKRSYKPYVVQLLETNKVDYPGTDTPQSFESYIHLVDRASGENRDRIHIWMNNPLRYNGETFYQTSFAQDPKTGTKYSTLAVVANQGWMIPYVGCMIVAVGLLAHFLTVLSRFLRRRASGQLEPVGDEVRSNASIVPLAKLAYERSWSAVVGEFFPWIAIAILAGWAWSHAIVPRPAPKTMDLYSFGELPVMYEGRVKPFDTLARNTLKAISDRQTWTDDEGHEHSAVEWLLDVMTDSDVAMNAPVFHIVDPDLRDTLGITTKIAKAEERAAKRAAAGSTADTTASKQKASETDEEKADEEKADEAILKHSKTNCYSSAEFRDGLKEFDKQLKQLQGADKPEDAKLRDKSKGAVSGVAKRPGEQANRNTRQREFSEFAQRLNAFISVRESFSPIELPQLPTAEQVANDPNGAIKQLLDVGQTIRQFNGDLMARQVPLAVPPAPKPTPLERIVGGQWQPYATAVDLAILSKSVGADPNPNTVSLTTALRAYRKNDVPGFNTAVQQYRSALAAAPSANLQGGKINKLAFESFFNHFDPFFYGMMLYLVAFIVACVALLGWSKPLNRTAFWLVATTLLLHTAAMIARIYISGRPPVTTLYQAALFIGWAGVAIGLILELIYRLGIGTLISAFAGFLTLFIAQYLATTGESLDTFTVMRAVLDTQFWLATHVTCITLGYATTFIAGLIGVVYVIKGVFSPSLSPELSKSIARMIYGVLCFAIFFSFVGTVLGGLWADNSWGRFWGWDPKENGALIIVIWNALVLHARWDKMVGDRGLAVLAIGGNIAVAWSGFGVNELGAGLHSYGFTSGVAVWLSIFVVSQLALIVVGSLPRRLWRSDGNSTSVATT